MARHKDTKMQAVLYFCGTLLFHVKYSQWGHFDLRYVFQRFALQRFCVRLRIIFEHTA